MMAMSTKGRYSIRIMVYLASQQRGYVGTKTELAASEGTTPAYVQQLMMRLVAAGLVNSVRGRKGGFSLARPSETITVADVLKASEGDLQLVPCRSPEMCERAADCAARPFWMKATDMLEQLFQGTTVAQLAAGSPACSCGHAPANLRPSGYEW
jgi:Rrf2 family protein